MPKGFEQKNYREGTVNVPSRFLYGLFCGYQALGLILFGNRQLKQEVDHAMEIIL